MNLLNPNSEIYEMNTTFPTIKASSSMSNEDFVKSIPNYTNISGSKEITNTIRNLYEKPDLELFFSTKYEKNPFIEIVFYEDVYINKIAVYNRIDANQNRILPLNMKLYNNLDYMVKDATLNSFKEPLMISKAPPQISREIKKLIDANGDYESFGISDTLGEQNMIREWVDLHNSSTKNTYCRIIKNNNDVNSDENNKNSSFEELDSEEDKDNNSIYTLSCKTAGSRKEYNTSSIDPGYTNSQYFKDENGNETLDFCRCVGTVPNTYVSCVPFDENSESFSKNEFVPKNKPTGCQNMNGSYLKNIKPKASLEKCEDIMINQNLYDKLSQNSDNLTTNNTNKKSKSVINIYKDIHDNVVHSAFSTGTSIYLFKNSVFNKKQIVLIYNINTEIRDGAYIFNTIRKYKNLDNHVNILEHQMTDVKFFESIDATCYYTRKDKKNVVVFFKSKYYIEFDFNKNIILNNGIISERWPFLPRFFTFNLTAVVTAFNSNSKSASDVTKIWLFKGIQYIEVSLDDTDESLKMIPPTSILNINKTFNINLKNIDAIFKHSSYWYFINRHRHIKYDTITKKIVENGANNKNLTALNTSSSRPTNIWSRINIL